MNRRLASFLVRGLRLDLRSGWLPIAAALIGAMAVFLFAACSAHAGVAASSKPGGYILIRLLGLYLFMLWGLSYLLFSGSVAVEREEGSLDLLRCAGLSPFALYIGLTGPSLMRGILLFLPLVPVMCLTVGMGGVTGPLLISGLLLLAAQTLFLHGAFSLMSVLFPTRRWANFGSIAMVILLQGLLGVAGPMFDDLDYAKWLWEGSEQLGSVLLPQGGLAELRDVQQDTVATGRSYRGPIMANSPAPAFSSATFLWAHLCSAAGGVLMHGVAFALFRRDGRILRVTRRISAGEGMFRSALLGSLGRFHWRSVHGERIWRMELGGWRGGVARILLLGSLAVAISAWRFYWKSDEIFAFLLTLVLLSAAALDASSAMSRLLEREIADGVLDSLATCPGGVGRVLREQCVVALRFPAAFLLAAVCCAAVSREYWHGYLANPDTYAWPINPTADRRALVLTLVSVAVAWPFLGLFTRLRWPAAGGMLLSGAGLALALVIAFLTMELSAGNRWAFDRPAFFHVCALACLAVIPLCCLRIRHLLRRFTT